MIGQVIGLCILLIVGVTLLPMIQNEITSSFNSSNLTVIGGTSTETIVSLSSTFFIVGMLIFALIFLFPILRRLGILSRGMPLDSDEDDGEDYSDDEDEEHYVPQPKKVELPVSKITEEEIIRSGFD